MRVVVIRHCKVLHEWQKWCTSAEFDAECALYDQAQVDTASIDVVVGGFQSIYISALDRTLQMQERISLNNVNCLLS
jgi:hypothetical protein